MTKNEVAAKVSMETGYSKRVVIAVIESLLKNVIEALVNGENVRFAGFGKFEAKKRAARTGRNPQTNEVVPIPEKIIPCFKPSSVLKQTVNKHEISQNEDLI